MTDTPLAKTTKNSLDFLDKLQDLCLVTDKDVQKYKDAESFAVANFLDVPIFRPLIHKLSSTLSHGKFPTNDAKYWQCKKEAEVHFAELTKLLNKVKRCDVAMRELDYRIERMTKQINGDEKIVVLEVEDTDPVLIGFEIEKLNIEKEMIMFEFKQLEKETKYRISEVYDWFVISKDLKTKCRFDTENHDSHLPKSYYLSLINKIKDETLEESAVANYQDQLDTLKNVLDSMNIDINNV